MGATPADLPRANAGAVVVVKAKTWNKLREILILGWPIAGNGIAIDQLATGRSIRIKEAGSDSDSSSSDSSDSSSSDSSDSSDSSGSSTPSESSSAPPSETSGDVSSRSDSSEGSAGSQSPSSASKDCVVPFRDTWIRWHCTERGDVVFEDVFTVPLWRGKGDLVLPPEMIESCEPGTLRAVAVTTASPAACGVRIHGKTLRVDAITLSGEAPTKALVTVEGIRKGFAGRRWEETSEIAAKLNSDIWAVLNGTSPLQ